ncbi:MAG: hypothetical protein GKR90_18265 [Pseudomonadales bacterium]|nr:hypothetical protein [Pseudomonadales bacterium]
MQKLKKRQSGNGIKRSAIALLTLSLLITATSSHAARFFRYVDENGKLVLSHTIPNDRVKYGYEVVDESARVLQKIEPQLTETQYREKLRVEAALKECRQAIDRVQNLFQSQTDIDYAEEQALTSIDNQITNTKANLVHLRNQREELETQAAQLDLSGKAISNALLDNIESARTQEQNFEEQVEMRYAEKLTVREDYNFERKVFELADCERGLPDREIAGR